MQRRVNVTCHVLTTATATLWLAGCATSEPPVEPETHGAESAYSEYATAAGGRVQFALTTLASGRTQDIAPRSLTDLVRVPDYTLHMVQQGTEISELAVTPRSADSDGQDDWSQPPELAQIAQAGGHALDDGTYRQLSVAITLDGAAVGDHQALELCWAGDGCTVLDPVVEGLGALVENRSQLMASGWGPTTAEEDSAHAMAMAVASPDDEPASDGDADPAVNGRHCRSDAHPQWRAYTKTWKAVDFTARNLFGVTVVRGRLGRQQIGIACRVTAGRCAAHAIGASESSSISTVSPFTGACKNTDVQTGATGPSRKVLAETRCAYAGLGGRASVSWTRTGSGASFSIHWITSGSVVASGGSIVDGCSWH